MIDYSRWVCVRSVSRHNFKLWEISDNISEAVQDRDIVATETDKKSYVTFRMAPLPVTLRGLELLRSPLLMKPYHLTYVGKYSVCCLTICLHMNRKTHAACNFNHRLENEGLLKIIASLVHCKMW